MMTATEIPQRIEREFDPGPRGEGERGTRHHRRRRPRGPGHQGWAGGGEPPLRHADLVGGGRPSLPDDDRLTLELPSERRLRNGVVHLDYGLTTIDRLPPGYRGPGQTGSVTTWVRVRAPVRVLDAGGWTDTWFAGGGKVCHLAVDDGSEVSARRSEPGDSAMVGTVDLAVPAFGDRYRYALDESPGRHPLLEAVLRRWARPRCEFEITVAAAVPSGSGLGTSASVVVALIGALQALAGDISDPGTLARSAHQVETEDLGLQSGVQDQIAAAYGGANLLTIDTYPEVEVQALELAPATWDALAHRLVTVYLGFPHSSSVLHEAVIAHLTSTDGEKLLAALRAAASDAANALVAGDLDGYGEAMIANTEAQAALHPALVDPFARQVIELARRHGAAGWKVNGAGGEGGTVTVVGPDDPGELVKAIGSIAGLTVLPLRPARAGARVVDQA